MKPQYAKVKSGYRNLFESMKITRQADTDKAAKRIIGSKARYQAVEKITGVPWFVIAAAHNRESGGDFTTYLGNGQKLLRKTTIVPKGRGPFPTWEAGAVDAIQLQGWDKVKDWPLERCAYELESFNGWGYFGKINSPYLWAGSSLYTKGKYLTDGKFSPSAVDQQLGCMPLLARLATLDADVRGRIRFDTTGSARPAVTQETTDMPLPAASDVTVPVAPWYQSKTVWASVLAAAVPILNVLTKGSINIDPGTQDWLATIITTLAGIAAAGFRITASTVTPQAAANLPLSSGRRG